MLLYFVRLRVGRTGDYTVAVQRCKFGGTVPNKEDRKQPYHVPGYFPLERCPHHIKQCSNIADYEYIHKKGGDGQPGFRAPGSASAKLSYDI